MFIPHLALKKLQSLSTLYLKESVSHAKISIRTVSSSVKPKESEYNKMEKYTFKKRRDEERAFRDTITKISNILRFSTWDDALRELKRLPLRWRPHTVNQVLKTHPPMEKAWLFFNWVRRVRGFYHDQHSYTTMLDIFGEARRISSMMFVFDEMKHEGIPIDGVTYTSMLHWLANDGDIDGAISLWKEMREKRRRLNVISYTAYIKILFDYNRESDAADVFREMLQVGPKPNCHTYTVLMVHLANSGKLDKAMDIFMNMKNAGAPPDKAACNILMEKCSEAGKTSEMTKILLYMKANRLILRYPVYAKAIKAFANAEESDMLLRQVNPHSKSFSHSAEGPEQKALSVNNPTSDEIIQPTSDEIIILMLLKKKSLVVIDHLLSNVVNGSMQLDSRSISTIIEVNVASERQSGALLAFDYSVNHGISINYSAYLALIGLFVRTNVCLKVVKIVEKMLGEGLSPGTQLSALLIYRLGCAIEPDASATVFNVLPAEQKNTATYTALIGAYFASRKPDNAIQTFETMKAQGIKVALGTYSIFLAGLEKSRSNLLVSYRKEMKSLHAESISQITSEEEVICNLLFSGTPLVCH